MEERIGDLITLAKSGEYDVVLHGCNCFNTMGKGVAKQIASEWPEVAVIDRATRRGDRGKLGTYTLCWVNRPEYRFMLFNLYTQYYYGSANEHHFDHHALWDALVKVETYLRYLPNPPWMSPPDRLARPVLDNRLRVLLPMIGAGYGGGDWEKTSRTIQQILGRYSLTCVRYEPQVVEEV